jgi:hypothetical protein
MVKVLLFLIPALILLMNIEWNLELMSALIGVMLWESGKKFIEVISSNRDND